MGPFLILVGLPMAIGMYLEWREEEKRVAENSLRHSQDMERGRVWDTGERWIDGKYVHLGVGAAYHFPPREQNTEEDDDE